MSGAAGGVTINKEDLKATIRDYRETVLKPLNLDKSYNITGIRRRPEKTVFGDIDIVLSFSGGDKKQLKQDFAAHLEQIDKIPQLPHKKNRKYFIHGSIVTNLYPIVGKEDQYVQIDNIITPSPDEGKFTYGMLDLPAQEQGLALGLAKTIFTELNPVQVKQLFQDLNIPPNIETPKEGEEYDFNLNTSELSLRIVPIGKNGGREIWKSTKFNDIKTLLKSVNVDIEKDKFESIVQKIKGFKNRRSIDRLKGMFARNIRVGDAEAGRDKGIKKQQSLDTVATLENKFSPLVMSLITPLILESETKPSIAIFPGKFKPPHRDHLARIKAASQFVGPLGTVKVIISPKETKPDPNQETITATQSMSIFHLYQDKGLIPGNVKFEISQYPSPVVSAWKEFETNKNKPPEEQQPYIAVFGKNETKRYSGVLKIPNITINDFPEANIGNESATNIRVALKNGEDISKYLPKGVNSEEYTQALNINTKGFEEDDLSLPNPQEKSTPPPTIKEPLNENKPITIVDNYLSKNKKLYEKKGFDKKLGKDPFGLNQFAREIMQEEEGSDTFDYLKHLKLLTNHMLDKGINLRPLPTVKFINDDGENAKDFFGKTAYYNPNSNQIVLYTLNRHPKDVMRSFAHEMIHHHQNCEDRLGNITTQNTNEEGDLPEIEREAYEKGNMTFRNWTDTLTEGILKEGRYDTLSNQISRDIFYEWKEDFKIGDKVSTYEDNYNFSSPRHTSSFPRGIQVKAKIIFKPEFGKLNIDGGSDYASTNKETGEKYPGYLEVNFVVDPKMLPEFWEEISMNLKDVVRHEIEHITQSGDSKTKKEDFDEDFDITIRALVKANIIPQAEYFKLPKEVDANLQGMYFRAKKERRPFIDVINTYLDAQKITPEEKEKIMNLWRSRRKTLSLPEF